MQALKSLAVVHPAFDASHGKVSKVVQAVIGESNAAQQDEEIAEGHLCNSRERLDMDLMDMWELVSKVSDSQDRCDKRMRIKEAKRRADRWIGMHWRTHTWHGRSIALAVLWSNRQRLQ